MNENVAKRRKVNDQIVRAPNSPIKLPPEKSNLFNRVKRPISVGIVVFNAFSPTAALIRLRSVCQSAPQFNAGVHAIEQRKQKCAAQSVIKKKKRTMMLNW